LALTLTVSRFEHIFGHISNRFRSMKTPIADLRHTLDAIYRTESRRVLATLIRLLGDFDLAEEALSEAFSIAAQQWPQEGLPANPRAWLVSTGRFKAIDQLRRRARFEASLDDVIDKLEDESAVAAFDDDAVVEDDQLRLIFTCCHPALAPEAQVALTLREVCGLTTEEIARAFLSNTPTLAQRIVRAKAKIRDAKIPYEVPTSEQLPERLESVLRVIYLVFNEGYSASQGDALTRSDIASEAIRLARLVMQLLISRTLEAEAAGLLALMLLHDARSATRTDANGDLVLLDEQDRSFWNREQIAEGALLVTRALQARHIGPYVLQAAIAAVHAEAPTANATDWAEIAGLYELLLRMNPSPVVELNRAVAIAMRDGPAAGLALVNDILARGDLVDYHLAHSARADFHRQLGQTDEALEAYRRALTQVQLKPERRFLERRIAELGG